jgi:hypothetical protein
MRANPRAATAAIVLMLLLAHGCALDDRAPQLAGAPLTRVSPIADENQLTGSTGWQLTAPSGELWAYARSITVRPGFSVSIKAGARTAATTATWQLWRLGYYNGAGGRLIKSGGPVAIRKRDPLNAPMDPELGYVSVLNYTSTFSFTIPSTAVTGVYVVKLTSSNAQTYAPIIVKERSDATVLAPMLVVIPVNTYQAYNNWGGISLYDNDARPSFPYQAGHAVSFDRPFSTGGGTGLFRSQDLPFVQWVERQGYDLAYATDIDLDSLYTSYIVPRKALVIQGHNEYWTYQMRRNVERAIDERGINVAFLGANICYWQARFEANDNGSARHILVSYKKDANLDPMNSTNPSRVTTKWRLAPVNRPENEFIGIMFSSWLGTKSYPLEVTDASSWIWAGTGVVDGTQIPNLYGIESDQAFANGLEPEGLTIVGTGTVVDGETGITAPADTAWYQAPSGALVFAAGSIAWSRALATSGYIDARIQRATKNVLDRFIQ